MEKTRVNRLAPLVIFAFNRPDALLRLKQSLEKNMLYAESEVFIYVDGPRNDVEKQKVGEVVKIAQTMTDHLFVAPKNQGLANSVIKGVSEVVNQYGKVIVLEDDLVVTPNFLVFMNQALEVYQDNPSIISVCGYGLKIRRPKGYQGDVYLSNRSSSWGWGTWKDRWENVDWEVKDWTELSQDKQQQRAFYRGGSDMYGMLRDYMEGRNKSWAIRFCYSQFKQQKYAVCPFLSKVDNEGFGAEATNCQQTYSRFKVLLDCTGKTEFDLPSQLTYHEGIASQLRSYHSIMIRIYSKLRKMFNI